MAQNVSPVSIYTQVERVTLAGDSSSYGLGKTHDFGMRKQKIIFSEKFGIRIARCKCWVCVWWTMYTTPAVRIGNDGIIRQRFVRAICAAKRHDTLCRRMISSCWSLEISNTFQTWGLDLLNDQQKTPCLFFLRRFWSRSKVRSPAMPSFAIMRFCKKFLNHDCSAACGLLTPFQTAPFDH